MSATAAGGARQPTEYAGVRMHEPLSNETLRRAQVPAPDAPWEAIEPFALTFDGYAKLGQRLGELAEKHLAAGTVPDDLDELRGCLFFEQRRWRHFQSRPDERAMVHVRRLLDAIRRKLLALPPRW